MGCPTTDRRYNYGYGRAEDLAGVFVIAMIALFSVVAVWVAVDRLLNPQAVTHPWAVAGAAVVGFVGNETVARYRIRVGRRIGVGRRWAARSYRRLHQPRGALGAGGVALGWRESDPVIGLLKQPTIVNDGS